MSLTFNEFYDYHFLPEHRHPGTVATHVLGTLLGISLVPLALTIWPVWTLLLFPIVHAAPGLLGHRLFERNEQVGDLRVTRTDFSPLWFIAANHRMTLQLCVRGFDWRSN
jgi:hypothetical protein